MSQKKWTNLGFAFFLITLAATTYDLYSKFGKLPPKANAARSFAGMGQKSAISQNHSQNLFPKKILNVPQKNTTASPIGANGTEPTGIQLYRPDVRPFHGVVVPDGMVLPEGYSRYYRMTDEGEALPPVLMQNLDNGTSVVLDEFPADFPNR